MAGVGRVTVSLRRSMVLAGVFGMMEFVTMVKINLLVNYSGNNAEVGRFADVYKEKQPLSHVKCA